MNTYQRNGRIEEETPTAQNQEEKGVRVDGFQQVLEMLCVADDDFRRSLLMRLEAQDSTLVRNLRSKLDQLGIRV